MMSVMSRVWMYLLVTDWPTGVAIVTAAKSRSSIFGPN